MKTTILNKEVNEKIDWSKPQWVVNETDKIVLFTNGQHKDRLFGGSALPCKTYPNGKFAEHWDKYSFQPIPKDGLTIHIQND
jgi:hypothetical protein